MADLSYAGAGFVTGKPKSSKKAEKGLRRLLVLAAFVLVAELIWLFAVSPCIPFSTVEIHGFPGFNRADILACAGITENSSFFSTNVKNAQMRLSAHNLVEMARVSKRYPDRLSIFLEGRKPAAVLLAYDGAEQKIMCVDRHGVVFKTCVENPDDSLPVVSGLEFDGLPLGTPLPAALTPLFESISQIAANAPELLAAVSEIRVERKAWDRFDAVIYPSHSHIRARYENNFTGDNLRYMLLALDVFKARFPQPEEVDFKSGLSSYKIKGGPF
ncbi:MAG: FtsQ-type POTRA domain-containing protein [Treponema sp.]|nr:FtsQ-type POTRA domain-containing protein [Treponema sp.]